MSKRKKKTHEYCSENAEVSGGNFLISREEDKALKHRKGGKRKDEKKGKKRSGEVKK